MIKMTMLRTDIRSRLACTNKALLEIEDLIMTYTGIDFSECTKSEYEKAINDGIEMWIKKTYEPREVPFHYELVECDNDGQIVNVSMYEDLQNALDAFKLADVQKRNVELSNRQQG